MKQVDDIKKYFKEARINTNENKDNDVFNKILDAANKNKTSANQLSTRRIIMKNRITKLAAAAVIIIGIFLGLEFFGRPGTTGVVYGMTDLPRLIKEAKTIHIKGCTYDPKDVEQTKLEVEYWFDIENGRYRLYKPGNVDKDTGRANYYTTVCDGQYVMSEGYVKPVHGEPWKTIGFVKLSPYQARLQAYKNSHSVLMRTFGLDRITGSLKVGREEINGIAFDIWQNEFYSADGRGTKIQAWICPASAEIGRGLCWNKKTNDPNWILRFVLDEVELDVILPAGIFNTEPPNGYRLENTKETAYPSTLGVAVRRSMVEDYELHRHIGFTLNNDSVVLAWSCPEKASKSQADLFEGLVPGGALPDLAAEIEGLTTIPKEPSINYTGYHLAYTQKEGNFYEWSIYIPNHEPPSRTSFVGYALQVKYGADVSRFGSRPGNLNDDLHINSSYDFNVWVLGAMAELSDEGKAPEGITYEGVLELAQEIRESLTE